MENPPVNAEDCLESSSVTFEWTVKNLRQLFDSTKGEAKSKVIRSIKFGGGRWQILFYPNAGPTKDKDGGADAAAGNHMSLYLSCEPTLEEKERSLSDGKWAREGTYKFTLELTNMNKTTVYSVKEAHNHEFTFKTANWGWAQFARRDHVYHNSNPNKARDAFIIVCTITSTPAPSTPPSAIRRRLVPKDLVDTVGALLDDPLYSDVVFVLPRRNRPLRQAKTIYASKRILSRASYFNAMFYSGFSEMGGDTPMIESSSDSDDQVYSIGDDYNDSDAEEFYDGDYHTNETTASAPSTENAAEDNDVEMPPSTSETSAAADVSEPVEDEPVTAPPEKPVNRDATSGPKKQRVVIQDVAYATYHAVLYWLYTDSIVFAPLSSSFSSRHEGTSSPTPSVVQPQQSMEGSAPVESKTTVYSRREWIALWKQENSGNLVPCSPKSVYRLADRLDLKELKERAAGQILKSLTVENIAHEVFSPFAATFDDIRKVEVEFFLKNWEKIRDSMAMRDVWQQIRVGRHPGFEEVWPVIVQSLVFLPPEKGGASVTDKH